MGTSALFRKCGARRQVGLSSCKAGLVGFFSYSSPKASPSSAPASGLERLAESWLCAQSLGWSLGGQRLNTAAFPGPCSYILEVCLL